MVEGSRIRREFPITPGRIEGKGRRGKALNACGVAIVLELARVMSRYTYKGTLKFAAWNSEEAGGQGSRAYAREAALNQERVALYYNFDSSGYDPSGRLVLDIMSDGKSSDAAALMERDNLRYGLGFTFTRNAHACFSDHTPFREQGFRSVMTHSGGHGPAHTGGDTPDKISAAYVRKNAQLGMAVLAELAGLSAGR